MLVVLPLVHAKLISLGDFFAYSFLRQIFTSYVTRIFYAVIRKSQLHVIDTRAQGLFTRHEPAAPQFAPLSGESVPRLTFEQVSFHYNPQRPVLNAVDLILEPGDRLAIVGDSGAGKSTLLRLMAGLFSAQHGRILLDNDEVSAQQLASQVWLQSQEDILFNASVLQNITLFDPWYSDSDRGRVEALVEKMALGPVVQALPGGMEALIRESHSALSLGQRQRLMLARALYSTRPILLFDEPTANLDDETAETAILALCQHCREQGKTLIVVTHSEQILHHFTRQAARYHTGRGGAMRRAFLRRRKTWLFALVAMLAIVAAVYYQRSFPAQAESIDTVTLDRGDIEKVVLASGIIKPAVQVSVGAQVSGQLRKLYVRQGERVRKGQLLAEIDPTLQLSDLRNATAQLASARAQKQASEATLVQYRKALAREQAMSRDGSGVSSDLEQAQAQYAAQVQQIAVNEAQIVQAEMSVQTANANLGYTRILAPMDGEVLGIVTREGQTIVSSQIAPTILVLADLDKVQVQTRISEADIQKIHPGQPLWFYVIADPQTRYEGELGYVQPAPQEALEEQNAGASAGNQQSSAIYYNGTFEVDNRQRLLKTSMTAQVFIRIAQVKDALRVPVAALGRSLGDERYLVVVQKENGSEERTIRIGINDRQYAQVLEGLQPGERVVIPQDAGSV